MFKFIQQYTEKMEHVAIYPMISLFIFFLFFVKKMDKGSITELSNLPLDIETTNSTH